MIDSLPAFLPGGLLGLRWQRRLALRPVLTRMRGNGASGLLHQVLACCREAEGSGIQVLPEYPVRLQGHALVQHV